MKFVDICMLVLLLRKQLDLNLVLGEIIKLREFFLSDIFVKLLELQEVFFLFGGI